MTFIKQPDTEGEKKDCPNCGKPIVSRLKEYKDFPSKIQWQNEKETKAHYDKDGNCNGSKDTVHTETLSSNTSQETTPTTKPSLDLLDDSTKKIIKNEATLLYHVRKQVESAIKEYEDDPNPAMIGQYVGLIWTKLFGGKK